MNLREQFEKETDYGKSNCEGNGYYPSYTEWLESKLQASIRLREALKEIADMEGLTLLGEYCTIDKEMDE